MGWGSRFAVAPGKQKRIIGKGRGKKPKRRGCSQSLKGKRGI